MNARGPPLLVLAPRHRRLVVAEAVHEHPPATRTAPGGARRSATYTKKNGFPRCRRARGAARAPSMSSAFGGVSPATRRTPPPRTCAAEAYARGAPRGERDFARRPPPPRRGRRGGAALPGAAAGDVVRGRRGARRQRTAAGTARPAKARRPRRPPRPGRGPRRADRPGQPPRRPAARRHPDPRRTRRGTARQRPGREGRPTARRTGTDAKGDAGQMGDQSPQPAEAVPRPGLVLRRRRGRSQRFQRAAAPPAPPDGRPRPAVENEFWVHCAGGRRRRGIIGAPLISARLRPAGRCVSRLRDDLRSAGTEPA